MVASLEILSPRNLFSSTPPRPFRLELLSPAIEHAEINLKTFLESLPTAPLAGKLILSSLVFDLHHPTPTQ